MSIPQELKRVADDVAAGKEPRRKVRTLLGWYGYVVRSQGVISSITQALDELHLRTRPDFRDPHLGLDAFVWFSRLPQPSPPPGGADTSKDPKRKPPDIEPSRSGASLRVGMLVRPEASVATVRLDSTVREATTKMLANDYSQLPVTQNGYRIDGIVSWRSIGKSLSLNQQCERVGDCLDDAYSGVPVSEDTPLLDAVERIAKEEVVLVRDAKGRLSGIITASDLSAKYHELAAPFLLLEDVENRLRSLIDRTFSPEEVRVAKDPRDEGRDVRVAADLTFGEYTRLLETKTAWPRLGIAADRRVFLRLLREAGDVRNDVMHFRPDEVRTESVTGLLNLLKLTVGE
ncbi:CBS domain-containing protein [Candidatus Palauibacter sp.]|uniref:CBS domain-containing protein n=1 Tax=Candidatus Palauibacter sp. TaxID=3101350 RepID=UPI003B02754D